MLRLYDYLPSGNGYKVRLLLAKLGIPVELINLDIVEGATRGADYLAKNPNGKIPLLELEDGTFLAESNAILFYLADGTAFLPADRLRRARALQWMFFEQYSHEPNIASPRFWMQHAAMTAEREAMLAGKREAGYAALGVMEKHLGNAVFFVGGSCSIADIALYAYTHVADEGGFDLGAYASVRAWLDRMAALPGHIAITQG